MIDNFRSGNCYGSWDTMSEFYRARMRMILPSRFESKALQTRLIATLIFLILGIFLNFISVPLFFGVHFVFGSIATLLAIATIGPGSGIIVAFGAAVHTYFLWGHPYAAITLIGEAAFVALIWKRTYANLPIASAIYWLFLGFGQVWIYYQFFLGMGEMVAQFAAVKQACNGILNALIAHLLVTYGPLAKFNRAPIRMRSSVFQSIFGFLAIASVLPALLFFVIHARQVVDEVNGNLHLRLNTMSSALAMAVENWKEQNLAFVRTAASVSERLGYSDRKNTQFLLDDLNRSAPDIMSVFILDEKGVSAAFSPPMNSYGISNVGLDLSDRSYFWKIQRGEADYSISPVLIGRGAFREPLVVVAHRISDRKGDSFRGILGASLNLSNFKERLKEVRAEGEYRATVTDEAGRIVVSSEIGLSPMDDFRSSRLAQVHVDPDGFYFRKPPQESNPMNQWRGAWSGKILNLRHRWGLIVELPFAPFQQILFENYMQSLGLLLILLVVIILISFWIAWWISRPLVQFAVQTTDLPERLSEADQIKWPRSPFIEFRALVTNMRAMTIELRRKFIDLESSTIELQETTRSLQEVSFLAKERAHRQSFLAHVGKVVGASLEPESILRRVPELLVPEWGDWCAVVRWEDLSRPLVVGWKHKRPEKESEIPELILRGFDKSEKRSFPLFEASFGVRFISSVREDDLEKLLPSQKDVAPWRALGLSSFVSLPLMMREDLFGTIILARGDQVEPMSEEDLSFFQEVSLRIVTAVDNARLYKEAQKLNRIKDEFLATLSHELRTPLGIILGNAEILKEEAPQLDEALMVSIDAIFRNAKVQNQIISDLLDVSAIVAGKINFHPIQIDLKKLLETCAESIRFVAESKGVAIQVNFALEALPVMGDPARLQQVFWNLLSNAVKFTPRGGEVILKAQSRNGRIEVEVTDNGQGIEADFLPHIFDRFRQEDNSMTRKYGGLGLGLSIVKQLVELHGGQIHAESQGKNKGALFKVFLPRHEPAGIK